MIRYALVCSAAHDFDGWFRSSEDFDAQKARGLVECPVCGSTAVEKALMAPAVRIRDGASAPTLPAPVAAGAPPVPAVPAALPPPEAAEMIARLRELKAKLTAGSENVGERFAEEARRIHYGETEARAVHGQASPDEARALVEEGVPILPLPILPDERN
ncbi:DUF1178 family protein [Oharaeibacter diazotrophicus]|uniref:DUF1178 family protein n=1 Tax=Oharaeibacter diazotrophicus TaxID=1920512 RepID=A0A4R6R5F1_9HYPH|nr:DUF1178 family protein [Oharaeibacter diazotrophicus]TDP80944.1 hypothetical protein EDD54_4577 [Oharaeibacter diazotrophicus]BBE73838.1 hypothetical protein OHA_1_03455 [Pleomorphomonas sp. SM30]GLS74677.1 hypothetical protein GCM10007904_00120 [Oharaeibacter diazotrophicus]